MAHSVFYLARRIDINLTLPDLGHPDLPELWNEIYPSNALPPESLQCLRCLDEYPDCPEYMYLRVRVGRREAVHLNKNIRDHATGESDTHKALKHRIASAAQSAGFKVDVEDLADDRMRRTDVLITGSDGYRLGCEAQVSHITARSVRKRTAIARRDNITPMWTTNNPNAALIDLAPWARIDRMPWHNITNAAELPVRGGVRSLAIVRCDRLGEVCPDKKLRRPCRGWHPKWNARGISLDNLIVNAAAQLEVPLPYRPTPTAKREYWYWVTARDQKRYLELAGDTTLVATSVTPTEQEDDESTVEPRELSRECTYGRMEWQPPPPRAPRDSGSVVTGLSVSLAPGDLPVRPIPQSIRRGHCFVCDATGARLYPAGWRCNEHRPTPRSM
jgi:hypothetical protein